MPIQINLGQRSEGPKIEGQNLQAQNQQVSNATTSAAPILGGDSLKVTSGGASDLEKLVARIKSESESTRQSVAQRRIAILMTVLSAMSERVTEAQKSSFVKMESLNEDLAEAEKFLEGLETEKSKASARSAELQAKIDALESAIKNAIQQGKDHNKQVEELKRQKAEVDAKIRGLTNAIASAKAKIASIEGDIAACANAIGAATMNEVAAAVKAAAGSAPAPEESESQAEIEKQEKKAEANNPVNVIREALDRLDADILRTIEENQVVKA